MFQRVRDKKKKKKMFMFKKSHEMAIFWEVFGAKHLKNLTIGQNNVSDSCVLGFKWLM